jgi:hypothetical protein
MYVYRKKYDRTGFKFCKVLQGCAEQGMLKMTYTGLNDWHALIPVR